MKNTTIKNKTSIFNDFTALVKLNQYKYKLQQKQLKQSVDTSKIVGVFGSYTLKIKFDKFTKTYIASTITKEGISIVRRGGNEISATNELISALM